MQDIEKYDDPIWEYILNSKLVKYVPHVRKFWENIQNVEITGTGVYPVTGDDVPPGLMYRVTNTPVRSPIKHVQVFPFVPVVYLQLANVSGGASRMVSKVCADDRFKIEEFVIVEKSNLPSTYHQGQFVAFVPEDILSGARDAGKWVYMTTDEMRSVCQGNVPFSVRGKLIKYI